MTKRKFDNIDVDSEVEVDVNSTKTKKPRLDLDLDSDLKSGSDLEYIDVSNINVLLNNALMSTRNLDQIFVDQNLVKRLVDQSEYFTHTIKNYPKISDQGQSGRCWMFASLYPYRVAMIRDYSLSSSFDFSTSWLYYFHKLENFRTVILTVIKDPHIRKLRPGEDIYKTSISDGGWSDYFFNLVDKHGLVPKEVYGESTHTCNTRQINKLLRKCLDIWLHKLRKADDNKETIKALGSNALAEAKQILDYCLGVPPKHFSWSYKHKKDNNGKHNRKYYNTQEYTPLEFWKLVKKSYRFKLDPHELINDPVRPKNKVYTGVHGLTNVYEQPNRRRYLNIDTHLILEYMKTLIREGLPVTIGLDISIDSYHASQCGILSHNLYHYNQIIPSYGELDYRDRVESGIENINHAVCITGYNDQNKTWQIANSWGQSHGYEGYWIVSEDWFHHHIFTAVIPNDILDYKHKELFTRPPAGSYTIYDSVC